VLCCTSSAAFMSTLGWRARGASSPGQLLNGPDTRLLRSQEDAQVRTGLQRVLSTSAGHSLSPAALAELRFIAAAKSPPADSLATAVKARASAAVGAAGPSEMATILEAKHDSPAKAAHHSAAEHAPLSLAPGLPPLRASLPAPLPSASSAVVSDDTAAGPTQPGLTSTAPDMLTSREGAATSARSLPAPPLDESAPAAAARGLPTMNTRTKRETRRRLAFQPPAADVAGDGKADGMETLRRTVAVPSDLATLAAGGSRPVRCRLLVHLMHPSTPFTDIACYPRQLRGGVRPDRIPTCTHVKPGSSATASPLHAGPLPHNIHVRM